jgi:hypothetical protein
VGFSELCPWASDVLYDRVLGSMLRFPGKVVLRLGISLLLPSQAGSDIDFRNPDAIRMRHFSPRFATLFCQLYIVVSRFQVQKGLSMTIARTSESLDLLWVDVGNITLVQGSFIEGVEIAGKLLAVVHKRDIAAGV